MAVQVHNEVDRKLADSLKKLAASHPIEKITIKDITDEAGVIRPTFYNHFQDKYELLEWIIGVDLLQPIFPLLQHGMTTAAMVLLFSNIERERDFYTRVVKLEGPVTFHDIAQRGVKKLLLELIEERMTGKTPKHEWLTPDVVAAYYAQSMCFITESWVRQGMPYGPQEMAEAYQYMITRSMEDIINEL